MCCLSKRGWQACRAPASQPHLVDHAPQLHRRFLGQGPHQAQPPLQALQLDLPRVGRPHARREQHHELPWRGARVSAA